MGVGPYDGNDTYVLGDDGSADGVKITSSTVGGKKALDVSIGNTVPIATTEDENATFVALALSTAIANNKSMISIVNAGGSGVKVRLREIRIINVQNAAVTGIIAEFRLLPITGHSSGTSITPLAHDSDDTLSGSVTVRTGSTVAGETAANVYRRWQFSSDEWGVGASDVESNSHDMQIQNSLFDTAPKTKTITANPGEGFTIKQVTNSSVGTYDILLVFTQETI